MILVIPSPTPDQSNAATAATQAVVYASPWDDMMAAAQRGHAAVYRRLLDEVGVWLRAYFANRLPASLVDDAVQETLIAIHEKRHTYDPARPFRHWLGAIARYKWIDRLRSMPSCAPPSFGDPTQRDHAPAIMSAAVLEQLLRALKPAQSTAIRLVKLQGLSIGEAALQTGQSASLVKVNIHRGLTRLMALVRGGNDAAQ